MRGFVLANQAHPNLSSSGLDSNIKDSTNNNTGLTTFPFDPNEAPFRRGKLKEHLDFWKNEIQGSEFVLDIIKHGHKPTLRSTPEPCSIPVIITKNDLILNSTPENRL